MKSIELVTSQYLAAAEFLIRAVKSSFIGPARQEVRVRNNDGYQAGLQSKTLNSTLIFENFIKLISVCTLCFSHSLTIRHQCLMYRIDTAINRVTWSLKEIYSHSDCRYTDRAEVSHVSPVGCLRAQKPEPRPHSGCKYSQSSPGQCILLVPA